ncbi:VCBS domain-containing protein [Vibrio hepatarius]|uniref:VCBS domain-containing protein n=1 Tax=Vibrio hepatarius TaxID=171383 RepID=UPI001C094F0F|nr:VCBS domain-containing protein [Vibrio hepatarius]MBU2895101.1 VCBS domain-containing protein [Vibrio hepatarius]
MANKKNVEANKKNTEIKNKKSNELEQKKPTKKKKLRLHSHLKVNIPLFQSLMMILPSLAKHAAAEDVDNSGDNADQVAANNVTAKDSSDHHGKTDSSAVTHQEAQTSDSDVNSTLSASHAPHGSSSHLFPSHHLSTLSHPQVYYIPSVSMPTISSGSNGQPTHSNAPTTTALPVTFMSEVIKGTYGELHVDANGQYTFVLNPKSPQYILLNQHQQGTDHFLLHLSNGSSVIVQVPVTGKQDTPSISGDLKGVVTEDHNIDSQGLLHANGKIDVIDPDQNESSVTPEVISGKYGSLTIDSDGHWQYQVDNSLSNVQALTGATSLHESFTIHTKDGTPQTIDMTIGGNDDNAVITGVDAGTVTEDLTTQVQGQLSVTDSDLGEDHFQASQVTSNFGTLSITKDGAWTYNLDNNNSVVQGLGQGSTATDIVTVYSADGTAHQVMVTINGTNDKAVIGGTDSGTVTEESQLQTSGTLTVTDVDTGEAHFSDTDIVGNLGTLHLTDSGAWTYNLDNTNPTVQALGANKTATDTITVHSADGTPHQVTITINGTNDTAVIGGTNSDAVTEESQLQTSGTLTVTDVDTGEAHFSNTDVAGSLGTLHLTDSGAWTYDLDNTNPTVQALGKGATATDTITVHSADGTSHQVTITVNGTNDAAVIMGTSTGDVHEGHTFTAPDGSMTGGYVDDRSPDHQHGNIGKLWNDEIHTDGHLSVVDADAGESYAQTGTYYGTHGRVILQTNGDWTYYASIGQDATGRAIDHLGKGESLTDTVTVKSADGTTHDIVVTIHGDNDSPYYSSEVQLNSGKEDLAQTLTATELLANTIDVDTNDIGKLTITNLHADHGSIQDNQDGTFTFTPTKDYNGQVHFTYDVTDAHGGVTATGANLHLQATGDAATITGIDQGNVTEDRGYIDTQYNLHFDGKLDIVDPDQGEAQFDIQRGHTYHGIGYDTKMGGWVLLQQDGTYTYTIDNRKPEIQNLGSTETLVDKVTIHSVDGTSHEIQITIHGTNDDPKVSSVTTLPAGAEDTDVVLHASDLLANATDIDHNDAGQLSVANLTADHGKITDNHDGTFTFHPALDYNGKVSFSYNVKDAHAGSTATSASMTLAPTSDAAVITGSGSGVKEDINVDISSGHLLGASGVFHVVDPDGPAQSQFPDVLYGGIYQGSHGGDLQVNSNGNYYYHISNYLVQHLSEGETLKEEYTIHSVDGTQHKVEFTVEGTNDKPVLSTQSQSVTEGGTLLSGQMHATDVDTKDTHTFTIDKPVDGLTFNNDGSYTFDPSHASYQNLGANNDQVIHVQVKVDDHNGGTDTKTLTLVVHGTNDGATIGGQDTFTVQEDHNLTLNSGNTIIYNGQLTITDADAGEDHFDGNLHQNQQTGTWDTGYTTQEGGKLILQSNGSYRYEIDNSLAKIQSLGSNETLIDTVTVRSADGTPHQIQVTIQGDNDAPVVSSAVTLAAGTEDTDVVLHVSDLLANATDIDHNDAGQLSVANLTADHGKITDNHDGTFTFHPNQDYNGKVSFTYDVLDKHGGSVATTASITLAPTRDSAVISGNDTGTIIEDHNVGHSSAQKIAISGSLSVTDPDTGEDHFRFNQFGEKAIHDPFGGDLRITPAGSWGYEVSNSRLQSLAEGEVEKVVYRVYSADYTAHDITITVTGTNDQPTITATTLAHGTEDTHYQMQASQFGFTDIDTGDTLHSVAITDLPSATQGKFLLDGHDITTGQQIPTADISKLQFVPTQDFNGDVQFKYTVNDGHVDSQEATNTLHIDPIADAATFTGDSGSISEDTNIHHNLNTTGSATIPDALFCHGHLIVSDADGHGEAALDLKGQQKISLDGTYGHFDITSSGRWVYKADNDSVPIQDLDNGQTLTDSIEVTSKDGTKHSITVTINGTTDDPVLHSLSDSGVQHSSPVEGNLLTGSGTDQGLSGAATDTDSNAHLVLQDIQIKDPVSGYVAVRPGQPHTMAGIGTLAIEANGHYTFTPEAGFTGKVPSMVYRVGDDGGNPIGDSSQNSLSIEVTPPLQHAPTVTGQTVSTNEDITRTFTTSEFGYSDQDGDALQFVTISSIPSHGLLLLNGNAVTANQQISKADIDAGHLTFTPINNENGANYAQFTFTANDGHKNSANATMVVDVNAVNDAPIVGSSFISSLEDKPHAFTTADFKYSDIDGDALNHITITNVAHGVLSLNGTTVNVGDDVSASDVSSLIFTPTHNYFSSGVSGLGAVQFTANDGHLDSKEGSILINIASVADPATFSGDSTGVVKEDITLQASGTLTASDPDGTAGFTAVQGGAGIAGSKGYGHAHIDVNGHWTYDLDNNHPIVQQLGEGQTDTETITVQSADGTHHDIVVTITGTNDAPILGVNQTSSTAGTLTETDVDVTDSHTFSIVSSTGQFGSLSVDPDTGDYIYTPNTSITGMSYNSATNSYHGVDVFEVKVSDGHTEDSKFITFDASGHVTMSPTGGLVISTTVPQQPTVTTTLPTLLMVTNVASTNSVTLDLASTSDSGSSNTDNQTNATTPTITGHTDIPFSKVTIYDGSTPVGHAVSDASGQYSVAVSSLSEGVHNLSAKALAPSSVLPATSSLLSVHIDTQVHIGIQTDPITADNVINAQESNSSIDISGSVSGDFNAGDIVTLDVNGTQHTGVVDAKGHYSIAVPGSELIADADQKIEASVEVTDSAGNSAHATADVTYQVDTQVSVPTITFENAGADNLYSKAEIARGQANTITATVTPPSDAKIGEHLVVNGQDHVLDARTLQHGIQIEVHPGSNVQATMTDEHGNTAGSQGFAASAIPEPIIVRPPSGSHQVSGTLGVPPLLPSLTPVPTAQSGWRIHLPNGQYVTSHHGQYGTLTIDPQTGHLHYQEQAQVHTGPHGSASGIGQHEDKFEVALQGTNQDEVVAHVNIQILSHGPGHSGKLTVGTEVVDMTITPLVHTSHPAPPPPPPVQHDEPDMASQADFTVTLSDDSNLDLTQQTHQEPDEKTSHHGAAAYLDALGIKPDATSTTVHDQPADMDIVLAQVDQQDATTHDQAHLDMSDALEHHDANINHNQDDEHHHHNDIDRLPDIDPNS